MYYTWRELERAIALDRGYGDDLEAGWGKVDHTWRELERAIARDRGQVTGDMETTWGPTRERCTTPDGN